MMKPYEKKCCKKYGFYDGLDRVLLDVTDVICCAAAEYEIPLTIRDAQMLGEMIANRLENEGHTKGESE